MLAVKVQVDVFDKCAFCELGTYRPTDELLVWRQPGGLRVTERVLHGASASRSSYSNNNCCCTHNVCCRQVVSKLSLVIWDVEDISKLHVQALIYRVGQKSEPQMLYA